MKKSTIPRVLLSTGLDESDIRYATGFSATDPFVLLRMDRHLHLLVSALEASRARRVCPAALLHTPAELFGDAVFRRRTLAEQILAFLRQRECRCIAAGPSFPLGVARALERAGVEIQVAETPPFPRRAIKTPVEIARIARSQRAAVAALREAVAVLRASEVMASGRLLYEGRGLTSERLKAIIEQTLLEKGCTATGTIVAVGPQGARPHDEGSGPLQAGVPLVLDIFPRDKQTGYWGDITRTVVRGRATPEVRRMHRTVRAAQQMALSMVRPGVESRAVQVAVEEFFRRAGYETRLSPPGEERGFIHSVGHGIGLDVHESPGLRHEPGRLRAGNVVTVEPGLYFPGIGGVRIEDTVVVTPDGHKILARFPRKLEL